MKNMIGFRKPYTCNECEGYLVVRQEMDRVQTMYSETIEILKKVQSGEINADVLKDLLDDMENKNG